MSLAPICGRRYAVGWPYRTSGGVVGAQMNGYYTAAVKLLDGKAGVEQYAEQRLADPRILELIEKVWPAVARRVPAGYELVVPAVSATPRTRTTESRELPRAA